jgi:hypothetical protein
MSFKLWQAAIAAQMVAQGLHCDANESALLARQLEDIAVETYDVLYPELQGRSLVPVYTKVNTGAQFHTWRQYDMAGEAVEIADYGDDFPGVEIVGTETSSRFIALGASYGYSIQDLREAAFAKVPIDSMKATAARFVCEKKLDKVLAIGSDNSAKNGVKGLLNAANVTIVNPAAGTGAATAWYTATTGVRTTKKAIEIVADINTWFKKVIVDTREVHVPNTLLLDHATRALIRSTPINADDTVIYSPMTIEQFIMANCPWLQSIETWNRCETASAGGGGAAGAAGKARAMVYEKNPRNLSALISQDFEQFAPQLKNMKFNVNCHIRTGGVVVRYPKSALYVDGIQA